jgi:hypothetical protein
MDRTMCADCRATAAHPTVRPPRFEERLGRRHGLPEKEVRGAEVFTWWTCAECGMSWQQRVREAEQAWTPTGFASRSLRDDA